MVQGCRKYRYQEVTVSVQHQPHVLGSNAQGPAGGPGPFPQHQSHPSFHMFLLVMQQCFTEVSECWLRRRYVDVGRVQRYFIGWVALLQAQEPEDVLARHGLSFFLAKEVGQPVSPWEILVCYFLAQVFFL